MSNHTDRPQAASREERIRQRAHEIWDMAGRPHGQDADHWLQAQEEIGLEPEQPGASVQVPQTSGAAASAPDSSQSPVANRDVEFPRKASTTPRPTDTPLG